MARMDRAFESGALIAREASSTRRCSLVAVDVHQPPTTNIRERAAYLFYIAPRLGCFIKSQCGAAGRRFCSLVFVVVATVVVGHDGGGGRADAASLFAYLRFNALDRRGRAPDDRVGDGLTRD